jgi:hypothetical protein
VVKAVLLITTSPADKTPSVLTAVLEGSLVLLMITFKHYCIKFNGEREFEGPFAELHTTFLLYLSTSTLVLMVSGWALTDVNVIPFVEYTAQAILDCNYVNIVKESFVFNQAFAFFSLLFKVGDYVSFIANCIFNEEDTLIDTTAEIIANALVVKIFSSITLSVSGNLA